MCYLPLLYFYKCGQDSAWGLKFYVCPSCKKCECFRLNIGRLWIINNLIASGCLVRPPVGVVKSIWAETTLKWSNSLFTIYPVWNGACLAHFVRWPLISTFTDPTSVFSSRSDLIGASDFTQRTISNYLYTIINSTSTSNQLCFLNDFSIYITHAWWPCVVCMCVLQCTVVFPYGYCNCRPPLSNCNSTVSLFHWSYLTS